MRYKIPLYNAPIYAFTPLPIGNMPKADSSKGNKTPVSQTVTVLKTGMEKGGDTLFFDGIFPVKPIDFDLSGSYLAVADRLTSTLFFYDRKAIRDTVRWTVLQPKALRPATYRRYFKLADTANTKALEDSLEKKMARTIFGSNGSVTGITAQDFSVYFFVKYLFMKGFSVNNIVAMYELRNGQIYGPWLEKSFIRPAHDVLSDSLDHVFEQTPYKSQEEQEAAERILSKEYDAGYKKIVEASPHKFSLREDAPLYTGKGLFAIPIIPLDSHNYHLLSYYQRTDSFLIPISSVPLYKPDLWRENNLGSNFGTLTGHYPYFMTLIANELYDLKNKKSYSLPMPLGDDYDYSREAMRTFKPKMGSFIYDVVGNDTCIKVLYSIKEKADKQHRLYLLHYDLVSGKVLSQKEYFPKKMNMMQKRSIGLTEWRR